MRATVHDAEPAGQLGRLGAMHTILRTVVLIGLAVVGLTACSATGGLAPTPSNPTVTATSPASSEPSVGGDGATSTSAPPISVPAPPISDPAPPKATLVVPRPGRLASHPTGVAALEAHMEGTRAIVRLSWWSGVEPCTVLDSVVVVRTWSTIALTVREGADRLDVACIAIAQYKATVVDLGSLAPGTYTISAFGEAPAATLIVR